MALSFCWICRDVLDVEADIRKGYDGCSAGLVNTVRYLVYGKWDRKEGSYARKMTGLLGHESAKSSGDLGNSIRTVRKEKTTELSGPAEVSGEASKATDSDTLPTYSISS